MATSPGLAWSAGADGLPLLSPRFYAMATLAMLLVALVPQSSRRVPLGFFRDVLVAVMACSALSIGTVTWWFSFVDPFLLGFSCSAFFVFVLAATVPAALEMSGLEALGDVWTTLASVLFASSTFGSTTFRTACLFGVLSFLTVGPWRRDMTRAAGVGVVVYLFFRGVNAGVDPCLDHPAARQGLGLTNAFVGMLWNDRAPGNPAAREDVPLGAWAALPGALLAASTALLFQTFFSSPYAPGQRAFADPPDWLAALPLAAVAAGGFALSSTGAGVLAGALPLVGCALQCTADTSVDGHGLVRGSGPFAFAGSVLIAGAFPWCLESSLALAKALHHQGATGRLATGTALVWGFLISLYLAVLVGGKAPFGGELLQGRFWLFSCILGLTWLLGLAGCVPLLVRQQSSAGRGVAGVASGTTLLCFVIFLGARLAMPRGGPVADDDDPTLLVCTYNVQQGYTFSGEFNRRCVRDLLLPLRPHVLATSEANTVHPIHALHCMAQVYAADLGMRALLGAPGALITIDGAILVDDRVVGAMDMRPEALEVFHNCADCPTQTHMWTRARVVWKGLEIDVHNVHTEWFTNPSAQIEHIARVIREDYRHGPLLLVGDFNAPQDRALHPARSSLATLLDGTGLTDVFGIVDNERAGTVPLPQTEMVDGLRLDYVFARGLEVLHAEIVQAQCSDHLPICVRFGRKDGDGAMPRDTGLSASPEERTEIRRTARNATPSPGYVVTPAGVFAAGHDLATSGNGSGRRTATGPSSIEALASLSMRMATGSNEVWVASGQP